MHHYFNAKFGNNADFTVLFPWLFNCQLSGTSRFRNSTFLLHSFALLHSSTHISDS